MKPKKPDKKQSERFKETAQNVGADETGKEFEKTFATIAPPKPKKPDTA